MKLELVDYKLMPIILKSSLFITLITEQIFIDSIFRDR